MPPMASMPTTVETTKVRLVSTEKGRIGSAARVSTQPKSSQATTPPTARVMRAGLDQASSLPPRVATSTRATAPAFMRPRPSQSIGLVSSCPGRRSTAQTAIQAMTPSGRLIQNTQCQEMESVSQPPTIGPRTEAIPNMAPMGAM